MFQYDAIPYKFKNMIKVLFWWWVYWSLGGGGEISFIWLPLHAMKQSTVEMNFHASF
jgi:hypothetical protein